MCNGGLLLELDSPAAANWLKKDSTRERFLTNLGSGACIKDRSYQVILQFVPIFFNPEDKDQLRQYEIHNNLEPLSVLKAEWIKAPKDRKPKQEVATLRVYHSTAASANKVLCKGTSIFNRRVVLRKPKREPIRCLHCQRFGHERRHCKASQPSCGRCADVHETDQCKALRDQFSCANCMGPHPSYDRKCPHFWDKCRQIDSRRPENNLAFYPTDEAWTWSTLEYNTNSESPLPPPRPAPGIPRPPVLRQTRLPFPFVPPTPTNEQQSQPQSNPPQ